MRIKPIRKRHNSNESLMVFCRPSFIKFSHEFACVCNYVLAADFQVQWCFSSSSSLNDVLAADFQVQWCFSSSSSWLDELELVQVQVDLMSSSSFNDVLAVNFR